ncbi:hypothetical protein [Alteromonas facilis]|uniref:hypothetical protein n=1 Tax=Alteromonas facilis TaxID=2048004 RepID=UPI000C294BC5|nr:hypothetical protein [Alteromonas facilis]
MGNEHQKLAAEFICPDCGSTNHLTPSLCAEKYREHQLRCSRCKHMLEVVVADGIGNRLNVIASSLDTDNPTT